MLVVGGLCVWGGLGVDANCVGANLVSFLVCGLEGVDW